mmetsp:Transcript_66683/g.135821  ORF Transcript_66683/g.135821 Transcript_66683/m.135821 type:complete len:207 (-) Transcript_66683:89-709(-)
MHPDDLELHHASEPASQESEPALDGGRLPGLLHHRGHALGPEQRLLRRVLLRHGRHKCAWRGSRPCPAGSRVHEGVRAGHQAGQGGLRPRALPALLWPNGLAGWLRCAEAHHEVAHRPGQGRREERDGGACYGRQVGYPVVGEAAHVTHPRRRLRRLQPVQRLLPGSFWQRIPLRQLDGRGAESFSYCLYQGHLERLHRHVADGGA